MKNAVKRDIKVDIVKGLGIIMVVWAHANGPLSDYIVQFHMPLFFFISGMLFQPEKNSCKEYIIKKMKCLLFPFWGWNMLMFPLFYILYYWKQWSLKTFFAWFFEILLTVNKVPFLGATWFLPSLFWVSISVKLLMTFFDKNVVGYLKLIIISVCLCIIGFNMDLPYKISRTLICAMFYVSGFCIKQWRIFQANKYKLPIACCCGMIFIVIAKNNECAMGSNVYRYKVGFIVGAFAAIFCILLLAEWLLYYKELWFVRNLIFLGKNTFTIMVWHFLAFRIAIVFQIVFLHIDINALVAFPIYDTSGIWWIVYTLVGIYGSLLWKYILEHSRCNKLLKRMYLLQM